MGSGGALHLCLLAHDQLVEQLLALALGVLHLLLEQHGAHRRWNDAQALMEGRCDHRDRGRRIDGARSRLGTDSGRRVSHRVLIRGRNALEKFHHHNPNIFLISLVFVERRVVHLRTLYVRFRRQAPRGPRPSAAGARRPPACRRRRPPRYFTALSFYL